MKLVQLTLLLVGVVLISLDLTAAADLSGLSGSAQTLFHSALSYTDALYDPRVGHIYSTDPATPGQYDTRSSAMYATGLLLRNGGSGADSDVERATRIVELVANEQYGVDMESDPWFGTYPHAPDEPIPGVGGLYGTFIYGNYDPNWRDFVGTAWCLALATSEHLLSSGTVQIMERSLLLAAEGLLTRYQGRGEYANSINANMTADNLDQAYTNPWLMGTFILGFIGDRLNDTELKNRSDSDAQEIYDLFTFGGFNTFSEYNSPTYTGVDVYALALWVKYSPAGSKMRELGPFMLNHTMADIGTLYHADLHNLAGPWDRTYGFDMTRYQSVLGQFITSLSPEGKLAIPFAITGSLHVNDYPCFAALNAFLSPIVADIAPQWALENFATFTQEHSLSRKLRTNTEDPLAVRNVTAWLGANVAAGGQSLDEPFVRQSSMVAGTLQWILPSASTNVPSSTLPPRIGYIALSPPTASVVNVTASPHKLEIYLPPSQRWSNATLPSSIVFAVGGFDARTFGVNMTRGLGAVPGLELGVATTGVGPFEVMYNASQSFNGFFSYYVTYPVIASWPDVPSIVLSF
ncbi:hypothetical protein K439DRAFT_47895 [Ramaria rubella]|nr:hypothetical protein K439DRAFT_47895 [Ramaria rubella]